VWGLGGLARRRGRGGGGGDSWGGVVRGRGEGGWGGEGGVAEEVGGEKGSRVGVEGRWGMKREGGGGVGGWGKGMRG